MMKKIILILSLFINGCGSTHKHSTSTPTQKQTEQSAKIQTTLSERQRAEIVLFSLNLLDTKYKWGSKKPDFGIDCSGLVSYVFKNSIQIKLTGAARDIVKNGNSIPLEHIHKKNLEPGDLLFFNTTGKPFSHVGIYIGNNSFLHASSRQGKVVINSVFDKYYLNHIEEIKRI